jgi:hypothetical protein
MLKPRVEAAAGVDWDPIEEVVKLFKKEYRAAMALSGFKRCKT